MKIEQFEIWNISFDPSIGSEIRKTRPALVLSNTYYNIASGTIFVVPITSTEPKIKNLSFYVKLSKNDQTKLKKDSFINISQFRAVSKLRFVHKVGKCEKHILEVVAKKMLEILDLNILDIKYI